MNPHSAMKSAFAAAGVDSADVELDVAIARFLNQTGDVDRLKKRVERAIELVGRVQSRIGAGGALRCSDPPRQPVEGATNGVMPLIEVNDPVSLPSLNRDGAGHRCHADGGQVGLARPVREPSATQLRASATVANLVARTVLDRTFTMDGRPWGDVHAYELAGMRRDGWLARAVIDCLGPLNHRQEQMQIRDLIRPDQFEAIKAMAND